MLRLDYAGRWSQVA